MIYRTIIYRAYPTQEQVNKIHYNVKCCNLLWNKLVERYRANKSANFDDALNIIRSNNMLDCDGKALFKKFDDFKRAVKEYESGAKGKLKFKNYRFDCSEKIQYTTKQLSWNENGFVLQRFGTLKINYSKELPKGANVCKVTVIYHKDGYCQLYVLYGLTADLPKPKLDIKNSIGLDYDLEHFYVDSNGDFACYFLPYEKEQAKCRTEYMKLRTLPYNSAEYKEQEKLTAYWHRRRSNMRREFHNKLVADLIRKYDYIIIEDICASKILSGGYSHSLYMAWPEFVSKLKAKAELTGKKVIAIDRYYPSSRLCSVCGFINHDLTIAEDTWICPNCGQFHDRDYNAAVNILAEGQRLIAQGRADNEP